MPAAQLAPLLYVPDTPIFPAGPGTRPRYPLPVVREVPGEVGVLLFRAGRAAELWASVEPEQRHVLFADGAADARVSAMRGVDIPPDLVAPLDVLSGVLTNRVECMEVARACIAVADWAEREGYPDTALRFAHAAATGCTCWAYPAYRTGYFARKLAHRWLAKEWFARTIGRARALGEWRTHALGFIGMGNLRLDRGNLFGAREMHLKAYESAKRHGQREMRAWALHDLIAVSVQAGATAQLDPKASEALRHYGRTHPNVPALAHDLAFGWLERGEARRALHVLLALRAHQFGPARRVVLVGNIARAAGCSGERRLFAEALAELLSSASDTAVQDVIGAAFVSAARGAAALGDSNHANSLATRGLEIATDRGERKWAAAAQAVLDGTAPPCEKGPARERDPLLRRVLACL